MQARIDRAVLRDGSVIHLRPIAPHDRDALEKGFERLSPESRYRRFLTPLKRLSARELNYLTAVDHHDHEALLATEPDNGEAVGVARFVRLADCPQTAEVAITVRDDWHGRGVATVLLRELVSRAQLEGVSRFRALCLSENREAIEVLKSLGPTQVDHPDPGLAQLTIDLAQPT